MTDQTIPTEKVRELIEKFKEDTASKGIVADLRALLPTPQPTTGLLGRWAKHDDYGDVVCVVDKPDSDGEVWVRWVDEGVNGAYVPLDSLTFPHQATRPADVPAGEAWRIKTIYGEFNAIKAPKGYFDNEDGSMYPWIVCDEGGEGVGFTNDITLVCPLAPERHETDLQAQYDELEKSWKHLDGLYSARGRVLDDLDDKYQEAQAWIEALSQDITPRTVATPEEYDALPVGSIVAEPVNSAWEKNSNGRWNLVGSERVELYPFIYDDSSRTVLRYGWGDKQPAWRIEHDHTNLRVGEYIIDEDGDKEIGE